jgi:opacity protein-like surface antigen
MRRSAILLGMIYFLCAVAGAWAQSNELSLGASGVFTNSVNGHGIHETATNSGGGVLSYRHFSQPTGPGFEVNLGYTKNSQNYLDTTDGTKTSVQAGIHEFTGAYVYRFKSGSIRPFLLAGGGFLVFNPTSSALNKADPDISRQWQGAFLYGGGADFPVTKQLAIRAQFRGFIYKAPDFFGQNYALHTDDAMMMYEPTVGVVLRF